MTEDEAQEWMKGLLAALVARDQNRVRTFVIDGFPSSPDNYGTALVTMAVTAATLIKGITPPVPDGGLVMPVFPGDVGPGMRYVGQVLAAATNDDVETIAALTAAFVDTVLHDEPARAGVLLSDALVNFVHILQSLVTQIDNPGANSAS